jgi:sugar O-acyltransferase (sialic acid O-acetyltransferase NeuD family)
MIYNVLGKSNNMISLLLDAMEPSVDGVAIIKNIPVGEKPKYKMEKKGLVVWSCISSDWIKEEHNLLLGVIRVPTKRTVYEYFLRHHNVIERDYAPLAHPEASISVQTDIGAGVFISAGCILAPYTEIGNLVSINRGVTVGHHTKIGKFSTLNPGCNIAGGSSIGEYTTIGMGANIFDGVNVGSNTVIGAGSLVTEDIPDNVVAYGSPAKVVRNYEISFNPGS